MDTPARPLSVGFEIEASFTNRKPDSDRARRRIARLIGMVEGVQAVVEDNTLLPISAGELAGADEEGEDKDDNKWKVANDWSIRPLGQGVELKSPVFIDGQNGSKDWKKEIADVLKKVTGGVKLSNDSSTGLHVHVGVKIGTGQTFSLTELKKIALVVLLYEESIDELHAPHRAAPDESGNTYIRSNRWNPFLQIKDDSTVVEMVLNSQSVSDLQKIVNPDPDPTKDEDHETEALPSSTSRYYRVNFLSLDVHETVEFRQHAGTVDPAAICAWGDLVLALVRKALSMTEEELTHLDPNVDFFIPSIVSRDVAGEVKRPQPKPRLQ